MEDKSSRKEVQRVEVSSLLLDDTKEYPVLRCDTVSIDLTVVSDAFVRLTVRGYAPAVLVRVGAGLAPHILYIGAKSLADSLEQMRADNGGRFCGLRFRLRKETSAATAKYLVE